MISGDVNPSFTSGLPRPSTRFPELLVLLTDREDALLADMLADRLMGFSTMMDVLRDAFMVE